MVQGSARFAGDADDLPETLSALSMSLPAVDGFELTRLLGAGGMGQVYAARDLSLGREVALKMLLPGTLGIPGASERFLREARLLASLNHPHIATIHELRRGDEGWVIVMELLEGSTLAERLRRPIGMREALDYCRQIASAVEAAHKKEILHRDLKPGNIGLTAEERVKVLDFGLARRTERGDSVAGSGFGCGTLGYASPEQCRGDPCGPQTDVWGFACILYECLTGRAAFRPGSAAGPPPIPDELPPAIRQLLERCLEPDPARRLADIAEARRTIEEELGRIERASRRPESVGALAEEGAAAGRGMLLTRFVGREAELARVEEQLARARLVTLTGTGGAGKTRLAEELLRRRGGAPEDGIFVDLVTLRDPQLLPKQVASALGIAEGAPGELRERIQEALREREALIVLDNCEHLVAACARLVPSVLAAGPRVRILATSREPLGVPGEVQVAVPPLGVPPEWEETESLLSHDACVLFLDRARNVRPELEPDDGDAETIARICRHLDGIPLAIELAAARAKSLPLREIELRLADRFTLLRDSRESSTPHHRTLHELIDWSFDQLEPPERTLFRRLSVFAGSWSLETAERVCSFAPLEPWAILDLVAALVEKSLVELDVAGSERTEQARYRMLETIREYATAKLAAAGEEETVTGRHVDAILQLAERAEAETLGPRQNLCYERLACDHADIRAALELCRAVPARLATGMRIVSALWRYWVVRRHWDEGRNLCEGFLSRARSGADPELRARVTRYVGILALEQGELDEAERSLSASLTAYRALGNRAGEASCRQGLGTVALRRGDSSSAEEHHQQALAIQRELGNDRSAAVTLSALGVAAQRVGDLPRARQRFEESLGLASALGDDYLIAGQLHNLGEIDLAEGAPAEARDRFARALAINEALGHRSWIGNNLWMLAECSVRLGEPDPAREHLHRGLLLRWEDGDLAGALSFAALLSRQETERAPRVAAYLLGLAEGIEQRNAELRVERASSWEALLAVLAREDLELLRDEGAALGARGRGNLAGGLARLAPAE